MQRLTVKVETIKILVVFLPACAVSVITVSFGVTSPLYLLAAGSTLLFGAILSALVLRGNDFLKVMFFLFLFFLITCINALQGVNGSNTSSLGEFIRFFAIVTIGFAMLAAGSLSEQNFRKVMAFTALVHVPVLYFLAYGNAQAVESTGRIYTETLPTASLSEIALGMAMAALLSRRLWIVISVVSFAGILILLTQMRTTGVALFTSFIPVLIWCLMFKLRGWVRLTSIFLLFILSVVLFMFYLDSGSSFLNKILLLDDPHRGVSSGFSGRFENWKLGWDIFLENFFTGVGFQNENVNYTHNGFLIVLGQLGIFGGGILVLGFVFSMIISIQKRDIITFSVILALLVFYVGQPRSINFQLFPLIGLFAVARSFRDKPF